MEEKIIEKAKELGKMIHDSKCSIEAAAAAEVLYKDEAATGLVTAYHDKRVKATEALKGKEPTKEDLDNLTKYLQEEFESIMKNPVVARYIETNNALENLVQQVNSVLGYFITGEEQQSTGCSGNCSSCGGCH